MQGHGKQVYVCPVCKTTHRGFAIWRNHVKNFHHNLDPRYPENVSGTLDKLDKAAAPAIELHCTWLQCEMKFKSVEELYQHCAAYHGVNHQDYTAKPTALSQELSYDFLNYLEKHRRFEEEYPESA